MDENMVVKAINNRYVNMNGKHYLEKIIQIALRMPAPHQSSKQNTRDGAYHFMKRYEYAKGYSVLSAQGDKRDKIHEAVKNTIGKLFQTGLLSNPRRIERIVNKLILLEKIESIKVDSNNVCLIVLMLALNEYFTNIFHSLEEEKDYSELVQYITMSIQKSTTPSKVKKVSSDRVIHNYVIHNAYCNTEDESFYKLLQLFSSLENSNMRDKAEEFLSQIRKIKDFLELIG